MAYTAKWTAYYVGHGAMNYIEIYDNNGDVDSVIIIDAGSNEDTLISSSGVTNGNSNLKTLNETLSQYDESIPVIICVTHTDEDHYSYIESIISNLEEQRGKNVNFVIYIGSITEDKLMAWQGDSGPRFKFKNVAMKYKSVVFFLEKSSRPRILQRFENISLWTMCNRAGGNGKDVNSDSAVYCLLNETTAFLFMGDITGATMKNIINQGSEGWKLKLHDKEIVMTVPHHGSMHSMSADKFVEDCTQDDCQNWKTFRENIGLNEYSVVVSYGYNDSNKHPDGAALYFYSKDAKKVSKNVFWQAWISSWCNYKRYYIENLDRFSVAEKSEDLFSFDTMYLQRIPCDIYPTLIVKISGKKSQTVQTPNYYFEM